MIASWDQIIQPIFHSLYACADLLGLCRAEPPRPILPVTEEVRRRIADTLATLELS